MARRRYRMTPARRAALKKAQLASARKRRRKNAIRKVGQGAATIGGAFMAAQMSRYMANPRAMGRDYADARNWAKSKRAARHARRNPVPKAAQTYSSHSYQYGPWV